LSSVPDGTYAEKLEWLIDPQSDLLARFHRAFDKMRTDEFVGDVLWHDCTLVKGSGERRAKRVPAREAAGIRALD
jgi:hypothetical protein